MQFGSMPEKQTIDAVFIFRRQQEEYYSIRKGRLVGLEKAFDREPRKVLE